MTGRDETCYSSEFVESFVLLNAQTRQKWFVALVPAVKRREKGSPPRTGLSSPNRLPLTSLSMQGLLPLERISARRQHNNHFLRPCSHTSDSARDPGSRRPTAVHAFACNANEPRLKRRRAPRNEHRGCCERANFAWPSDRFVCLEEKK